MKYSALFLTIALAVFWTSAEARYNRYLGDVVDVMTKYYTEEMQDLPEPYKGRVIDTLNEAKNRQWNSLPEYMLHIQNTLKSFLTDLLRTKRHANYDSPDDNVFVSIKKIQTALNDFNV